jgi:hypothetical protein
MASRRAIAAAFIAALALVATIAVLSQGDMGEGFVAESAWVESEVTDPENGKLDVLDNLIRLKAYCLAAWDDARIVVNGSGGKYQAMTDFVLQYGQEGGGVKRGGRHEGVENIVSEYAQLLGAMRVKYPKGVNKYVLDSIDKAVRHDPNGVVFIKTGMAALGNGGDNGRTFGHLVALRTKALGLVDRPNLVVRLAAKYADYLHFKTIAGKQADNADAIAATMFLKSKGSGQYTSFLQREINKVMRKMRTEFNFVAKAAFGAEKDAFAKAYEADRQAFFKHVQVQTPAGVKAANKKRNQLDWTPPTLAEMKKIASKASKKFLKEFKGKNASPAKIIKNMVDEAGGVKIYFSTTDATDAQSTMKPSIEFVGSVTTLKGEMRAVPAQGLSSVQHFPTSKPIGKLRKVILTGTGSGLKWNVKGMKIRVGARDAEVKPLSISKKQDGPFWLESGKTVVLTVDMDKHSELQYNKQGCLKWHATEECDANGKKDPSNNKGCSVDIDSSMSGFCKCDTGAVAKVDCGHDTFTCNEMCNE